MTKVRPRVLIVDDEASVSWALHRLLHAEGYDVSVTATAEEALEQVAIQPPQVVILDVRLPGVDGLTALTELRRLAPAAATIVITAYGDADTILRAVKGGAFEYLPKPFDLDAALAAVRRAAASGTDASSSEPTSRLADSPLFVGRSLPIQNVFKRIALAATQECCVLLTGESGTGKELAARLLHQNSRRAARPWIPLHIAALNPELLESELFGHVRGAFTGAAHDRDGLLALADGGTLFLDEVADIPLGAQVKLLRVLESGEYFSVGAAASRRLDVRVVAATQQPLDTLVEQGRFRQDLYFRLNVFPIQLPPLRDRLDDLPLLVEHFLERLTPRALPVGDEVLVWLRRRSWPGNVRELRNVLERAAILARGGPLTIEHFRDDNQSCSHSGATVPYFLERAIDEWLTSQQASPGPPANLHERLLANVERRLLAWVMEQVGGNRWEAARWLGLNRATVRRKLVQHGLAKPA